MGNGTQDFTIRSKSGKLNTPVDRFITTEQEEILCSMMEEQHQINIADVKKHQKTEKRIVKQIIACWENGAMPNEKTGAWKVLHDHDNYHLTDKLILYRIPSDQEQLKLVVQKEYQNDLMYLAYHHLMGPQFRVQKTLENTCSQT